jgi:hypothetical protein
MRENPLSCKYISPETILPLQKGWLTELVVVVLAMTLDFCGEDDWFQSVSHQHRLS